MTYNLELHDKEVFRLLAIVNRYLRDHPKGESAEAARAILARLEAMAGIQS